MGTLKARVAGSWVTVGGTVDAIWVDPNAPADPSIELWYDTDAWGSIVQSVGLESLKPVATPSRAGMHYFATDTKRDWLCDGTGWIIMSEPAQTISMNVGPSSGSWTLGAVGGTFHRCDGWVDFEMGFVVTNNGTGSGTVQWGLPVASNHIYAMIGYGRDIQVSGNFMQIVGAGSTTLANIMAYNNAYPAVTGSNIRCGGKYQMASRYT